MTIQTEDTIAMKTEVKYQKKSVYASLMNQVSAAVPVLLGVIMFTMILIVTKGEI